MRRLRLLLGITAVAHVVLAWLVRLDAKKRGDDADEWVGRTLCTGFFGAVEYVRHGR